MFGNACRPNGHLDRPLDAIFQQVVAAHSPRLRFESSLVRRKHILPGPLSAGLRVLALYVAETLYSSRADLISRQRLEPVKALGFRIRAVVSDADKNIRRAVTASLPGCPHQACQVHCLCEASDIPHQVRQGVSLAVVLPGASVYGCV